MAILIQNISTEYLPVLDGLMTDYFNPSLNHERKEEIKQMLNNFSQSDQSWIYSIKFISESKSDYTKIYCFSLLHNFIIKNWNTLTDQVKNEMKDYFLNYLIKIHLDDSQSIFIQNKLCNIIATILRLSFPTFWPTFFDDCLTPLISNKETTKLGLRLLLICLEELLQPNDGLFEDRKKELATLLNYPIQQTIDNLSNIMRTILNKSISPFFVTPPASPIESTLQNQLQDESYIINLNNDKQINLKSICLNKNQLDNIDSQSFEILELALRCSLSLLSNLDNVYLPLINEKMLELLFVFATFGCSGGQRETSIGILSISCINELLNKNYVYSEFSSKFYSTLFETIFKIFYIIHNELDLQNLDNDYLNKFVDSLRFFITNQLGYRQVKLFFNFLEKFFQLSFDRRWDDHYLNFIDIWTNLLDIFINHHNKEILKINENDDLSTKLYFASIELSKQVLIKLQFRFNFNQLEELDNNSLHLNDYGLTELQLFQNKSIELLAKIAQLIPNQSAEIVNGFFNDLMKMFVNMDQLLGQSYSPETNSLRTDYLSAEDVCNLDYSLKDLIILVRVWQRLNEYFIDGEHFEKNLLVVQTLLDQSLTAIDYSNRLKLFAINCDKEAILDDLNELHQSLLLLFKFYSPWINLFSVYKDNQNNCNLLIQRICDECVRTIFIALEHDTADPKLISTLNKKIIQSSLICLLSISCSIRPKFLLELPSIQAFFDKLYSSINKSTCSTCTKFSQYDRNPNILKFDSCVNCKFLNQLETLPGDKCTSLRLEREQELIWIDICSNILILQWNHTQEQHWESRSEKHKQFIRHIYVDLVEQLKQPNLVNQRIDLSSPVCNTLKRQLFLFTNLVNNHIESPTKSKQILLASLIDFIEFILEILPFNILNNDDLFAHYILSFQISILEVFRGQIKLNLIDQLVKTLLDCITQPCLDTLKSNSFVEKVFKIFIFIVEQPNATFKIILPKMLDLSLNQLYQFVANTDDLDLFSTFYEFLYKFLLNNSRFFFKSQLSIGSLGSSNIEQVSNQQYFIRIFQLFGNSFLKSNMDLFKQNLVALDALNYRQKLFHKNIFKKTFLHNFTLLFIQTMINNEHKILHDELTSILFSLASANFEMFKCICSIEFVDKLKLSAGSFNQQFGKLLMEDNLDISTFSKQLNEFVNGIRYFSSNVLLV